MAYRIHCRIIACLALSLLIRHGGEALAADGVGTTLRQTVESAISYNPNVRAYQEYRQAAEYDLSRARSGWFPRVDVRAGFGFEQVSSPSTRAGAAGYRDDRRGYYSTDDAGLTVSQTIWDGLATWYRVSIGQSRLDSATSRLFDNTEALTLDALLAHIEIYRQRRICALAELNVKNHRTILSSQMERQRSGASTLADVTQTQSRLARTEASLAESRSALEVALANYKRLTGLDAGVLESPLSPAEAYPSLDAALSSTQYGNFKIKALQSDIETAQFQAELDKSPFHPQITLEIGPSYSYHTGNSLNDTGSMAFMLRAQWNLFDGGYDYYNVKGDKARARQARHELSALRDNISEETTATWSELLSAREQAKFYGNAVQYATRTRDMYLEQFNVGQRSLLDVLDAENEVFSSSIQYVTSQQNIVAGEYRLLALGGELLPIFGVNRQGLAVETADTEADDAPF
ncbi:MAG: TolC family outer membrane protein [Deltaproteobacteria bacterium]|jgi:adhesin transport system outer membrane protein|nr:TolC family outer membrane protein [Deltaproteobacteria bacterium]